MHYITFLPALLFWWYGRGLADLRDFILAMLANVQRTFSVKVILKTLFQPWKKMVGDRRPGLDGLKDWITDNLISRGVGFVVRVFMLLFSLLAIVLTGVIGIIIAILWLGMPALIVGAFLFIFLGY